MSIEPTPDVDLDVLGERLALHLSTIEKQNVSVVHVTASISNWDRIKETLLQLRSANISPILHLRRGESLLEDEEIIYLFTFLRQWDQFLLVNFMEICGEWIPPEYQEKFRFEAKTELKWFKEWATAASDPRIHKYPGLPWRSFMRKINTENFQFATKFLELVAAPSTDEARSQLQREIKAFLENKKKVVCVFPKNWNRLH